MKKNTMMIRIGERDHHTAPQHCNPFQWWGATLHLLKFRYSGGFRMAVVMVVAAGVQGPL